MLFMIACFVSGGLAIGLAVIFDSSLFTYSIPGLVVGAFFAFKYFRFDKQKARQEEHKRKRSKNYKH